MGFDVLRWARKKDRPVAVVPQQVFSATGREIDRPGRPQRDLGPALIPNRGPGGRGGSALTASASVLPVGDRRDAVRNRYTRQGWQAEAFAYLDGVGELRYVVQTSANAISRLRLFPAVQLDPKESPVALDEVGAKDMPPSVVAAAAEDMDLLNEPGHGLTGMQHTQSINKQTVGEYYIVGLPHDPDTGEESWSIRSIDEVIIDTDGRYWLRDRPPGFQGYDELPFPLTDDCFVARCWDQHPRFRALAWSQMRPLLESLEELLLASRMIRSTLRSRISGAGILLVPDELELLGINPTGQDAQSSPFFEELTKAMLTPIQSEGDASEVVPVVVKGPAEILKELRHLTLDRPIDQHAMAIRGELIRRIAIGVDWPPELLLGVGDVSHWAQWFVDESTFRYHYEPQGISSVRQWTQGFALPMLMARGWDSAAAAKAQQVVWWYDPTPLLTHPDRTKDAMALYGMDVLNDDALLRAAGFDPETDKPTEADFLVRLMSKFRSLPPNIVEAIIHRFDPSLDIPPDTNEPGMGPQGQTPPTTPGGQGGPPSPPDGGNPGRGGPPEPGDAAAITAALNRLLGHRETIEIAPVAAAANSHPDGAMVALYPTPEQAAQLALDGGEDPETLHVTLAYLGNVDDLTEDQIFSASQVCAAISRLHAPLDGMYGGVARFTASTSSDGVDPVVALPDVQGLVALRNMLCEHLSAAGVPLPSEHGFQPHTTLAYVAQGAPSPIDRLDDPVPATFGAVSLVLGHNRTDYPLTGVAEPLVAAGPSVTPVPAASRRLADIDVALRERIRTAADAALRRQLEKAAARLTSRLNGKPDLRAALKGVVPAEYASVLGQDRLTQAGIDEGMLLTEADFADLRDKVTAWIGQAQTQALQVAGKIVRVPDGHASVLKTAQDRHRADAVDFLLKGVSREAAKHLFDTASITAAGGIFQEAPDVQKAVDPQEVPPQAPDSALVPQKVAQLSPEAVTPPQVSPDVVQKIPQEKTPQEKTPQESPKAAGKVPQAKGEFDTQRIVSASLVRGAVAIAGGFGADDDYWFDPTISQEQAQARGEKHPGFHEAVKELKGRVEGSQGLTEDGVAVAAGEEILGGVGTGPAITAMLEANGAQVLEYEWVYGASVRSFEPHVALDGQTYTSHNADVLRNTYGWPETEFLYVGDHNGCDCTEVPTWGISLSDVPEADVSTESPEDGSVAASGAVPPKDLGFNPDQPRDDHGRWAPGGGGSDSGGGGGSTADELAGQAEAGGFSWSPVTNSEPTSGYMVGGLAAPSDFPAGDRAATAAGIQQFMDSHAEYFAENPTHYLGGWVQTNADGSRSLVVEPSENVADEQTATRLGTERNQVSVWDVSNQQEIATGGTGEFSPPERGSP